MNEQPRIYQGAAGKNTMDGEPCIASCLVAPPSKQRLPDTAIRAHHHKQAPDGCGKTQIASQHAASKSRLSNDGQLYRHHARTSDMV
jgi:hypothetical protein